MPILNFSGVSCADNQLYNLWTTGNTPNMFSTYSGITDDYYTIITPNYEGNTDGIEIETSTSYSNCLNTPDPVTFYYYDCTPCGGGSTTVIRSVIPNLHTYGWIIKDQANFGVCFTVDNVSISTTSNNITATYYDCSNCNAGYASSGLTVSGGYEQISDSCLSGQFGTLYIWGNNPEPSLDEPVFLDSNCTLPINGYNLSYLTNWNGPNAVLLDNAGKIQDIFSCTCFFTSILNEKLPDSTGSTSTCLSNLELIIQYSGATGGSQFPFGCAYHQCNAAVFWLKGNNIKITGGSVSDGAVWLNNNGGIYDKLNYPPGVSSGRNRYNSISADTPTAVAIASTSTNGFINFTLDCAIIDFFPGQNLGFGPNQCHTSSSFIIAKLNGNVIWSGCPAANNFSLNPCTGQVINNTGNFINT